MEHAFLEEAHLSKVQKRGEHNYVKYPVKLFKRQLCKIKWSFVSMQSFMFS